MPWSVIGILNKQVIKYKIYNRTNGEAISLQKDQLPAELNIFSIEETIR